MPVLGGFVLSGAATGPEKVWGATELLMFPAPVGAQWQVASEQALHGV